MSSILKLQNLKPYACPYPNRSSLLLLAVSKDDSFF